MTELTRAMSGIYTAKVFIRDYLRHDLPQRMIVYRNAFQLADDDLPTPEPEAILHFEPRAIDNWPMIYTVGGSMTRIQREDYDYGYNPIYRVTYQLRTYCWHRNDTMQAATESRDVLVLAVRSALLDHPNLRLADTDGVLDIGIDEGTMTEEYSDVTPVAGDRYLAGAYLAYTISMNEVVDRLPYGRLEDIEVQIEHQDEL